MKHHAETKEELKIAKERLDKCEIERSQLSIRVALLEQPSKTIEALANDVSARLEAVAKAFAEQLKSYAQRLSQ